LNSNLEPQQFKAAFVNLRKIPRAFRGYKSINKLPHINNDKQYETKVCSASGLHSQFGPGYEVVVDAISTVE